MGLFPYRRDDNSTLIATSQTMKVEISKRYKLIKLVVDSSIAGNLGDSREKCVVLHGILD